MNIINHLSKRVRAGLLGTALLAAGTTLAACSTSSSSTTATTTAVATGSATSDTMVVKTPGNNEPVLPVANNPINNSSTNKVLMIDSVVVENNLDTAGKAASDHLEISLKNSGTTQLTKFEVYYTFTDAIKNISESYYAQLPASFSIPAGGKRIAHFDKTGTVDHFPVNQFSLYYTDTNAMKVTVFVSAIGAAMQTVTVQKDAGGPETAD
ncbi:MAG: hypothetical protein D4R44_01405 [Actinobacteria bacterium]|nr:MAG: hypothetical protein D4R44_01405 [Actinomycetota bacterium]